MPGISRTPRGAGAVSPSSDGNRSPTGGRMPNLGGNGPKQWTPTVANLLVILVLEIIAFAVIRHVFRRVTS